MSYYIRVSLIQYLAAKLKFHEHLDDTKQLTNYSQTEEFSDENIIDDLDPNDEDRSILLDYLYDDGHLNDITSDNEDDENNSIDCEIDKFKTLKELKLQLYQYAKNKNAATLLYSKKKIIVYGLFRESKARGILPNDISEKIEEQSLFTPCVL